MKATAAALLFLCLMIVAVLAPLPAPGENFSPASKSFLKHVTSVDLLAIQSGQLAATRGSSPEVRKFGARMARDHSTSNRELKALAAQKNLKLPAQVERKHASVLARLSKLSGSEFDKGYLQAMVQVHTSAISRVKQALRKVEDPVLRSWAANRLPILQEQLQLTYELTQTLHLR